MVTSSNLWACWVTADSSPGLWGSCGVCATTRLVSSAKPTRWEGQG